MPRNTSATAAPALLAASSFDSRHRWKVLAAGVVANAAFSMAFSGIPMTAVLMRSGYRLDTATLGLMLGLMGLGIALSELPWGLLTDRWGDRPVLLTGLSSTAAALAAMALWAAPHGEQIPPLSWLAGGLLLVGLLGGSVNGASGRAVMMWFGEGERGLAMSIRQTATPLGGGIGALLLPALVLHGGFGAVYAVLAGLCAMGALIVMAWVHEPPSPAGPTPARQPAQVAAKTACVVVDRGPLHDLRVWRIVAGIGILCGPQFAVLSFGTVFLHDFGHASQAAITAAMVALQVGAMGMRIWSGRWTDRRRNRPAFLRGCALLSVLLFVALGMLAFSGDLLTGASSGRMGLVVLLALAGVCVSAWHGVAYTELASLAGATRAGTALGMANTSVFVVCFVTPLSIPHLIALQGWPLVWFVAAACALVARPLLAPAGMRPVPCP
ncbi:MFS transporter [Variovorax ginsengisoli]|uniref:MFS family permease n=1 Tax=Variovorax ginsengisoli TaxID=363844 RepID=A0ABT9S115_9BURK|nr:MFS transporter [Variovorax ginsengisoli]MDP9898050.1 MFS family permease [Variovorax ginsengisoli]